MAVEVRLSQQDHATDEQREYVEQQDQKCYIGGNCGVQRFREQAEPSEENLYDCQCHPHDLPEPMVATDVNR